MESFFQWLQDQSISNWIATDETIWSFPLILFLHSVGMGLTAGVMFMKRWPQPFMQDFGRTP